MRCTESLAAPAGRPPAARSSRARGRRLRFLLAAIPALALLSLAAPAAAAPAWRLGIHHVPTHFAPGGSGQYWFDLENAGSSPTIGPIDLTIRLPSGMTSAGVTAGSQLRSGSGLSWACSGASGATTVQCTTSAGQVPAHGLAELILAVSLAPDASGEPRALANLGGGGAPAATVAEPTAVDLQPAPFGILASSFAAAALDPARQPARAAASHPASFTVSFDLNSATRTASGAFSTAPVGSLRDAQLDLPRGFLGDPQAADTCTPVQLIAAACPRSSQVGRADLATTPATNSDPFDSFSLPLYNMAAPRGAIADLAFQVFRNPVHIQLALDPARGYSVVARLADLNETAPAYHLRLTLWGVPADPSHDSERCGGAQIETATACPTDFQPRPFLTLPATCQTEPRLELRDYDSWQRPGAFGPPLAAGLGGRLEGCQVPPFEPRLTAAPTVSRADSPTGLDLQLAVPQSQDPNALATPPLRDVSLTLPPGARISPSAAEGLAACTPAQIGLYTNQPVACPDASRLGEATLTTPLLPEPLRGFLYLATPHSNPTDSLFGLYLVVADTEGRGVLLKLPGHLALDPSTGRITASFEDLPQLPFQDLRLSFRSGSRAPLLSGPQCGRQTIVATATSWAQPYHPIELSDTYVTDQGPAGGPCTAPAARRFAPLLSAGTVAPIAAASTQFVFKLTRSDGEAPLSTVSATLPPGLSAAVAGVPACPEAAIAAIPFGEGTAATQLGAPSCPAASRLGSVTVAAGAGPEPLYLSGQVYLAGPYRGAPFSLLLLVPAAAGPFDLGTLSSRLSVDVDPTTAQLTLASEPLPRILAGVSVDLRQISLLLDRPGLIRNPTDCTETAIRGTATSTSAEIAPISERFQLGDCAALPFRPRLAVRLSGALGRNGHPALRAVLRSGVGQAGTAAATIALPPGELLDFRRLGAICRRRLPPERCPAASRHGYVRLRSPLLGVPLEGPIYLREPRHGLPDLLADLHGDGLRLILHAHTAARRGRLRLSFRPLPDIPFSRAAIALAGGRRGIIVNSGGLCGRHRRGSATFRAHSGKRTTLRLALKLTGCAEPTAFVTDRLQQ